MSWDHPQSTPSGNTLSQRPLGREVLTLGTPSAQLNHGQDKPDSNQQPLHSEARLSPQCHHVPHEHTGVVGPLTFKMTTTNLKKKKEKKKYKYIDAYISKDLWLLQFVLRNFFTNKKNECFCYSHNIAQAFTTSNYFIHPCFCETHTLFLLERNIVTSLNFQLDGEQFPNISIFYQ